MFSYLRCCHYVMFDFLLTNLFLSNRNLNQCVNKSDDLAPFNSLKNSVWQVGRYVPEEERKKFQVLNEKNFCSTLHFSRKRRFVEVHTHRKLHWLFRFSLSLYFLVFPLKLCECMSKKNLTIFSSNIFEYVFQGGQK